MTAPEDDLAGGGCGGGGIVRRPQSPSTTSAAERYLLPQERYPCQGQCSASNSGDPRYIPHDTRYLYWRGGGVGGGGGNGGTGGAGSDNCAYSNFDPPPPRGYASAGYPETQHPTRYSSYANGQTPTGYERYLPPPPVQYLQQGGYLERYAEQRYERYQPPPPERYHTGKSIFEYFKFKKKKKNFFK